MPWVSAGRGFDKLSPSGVENMPRHPLTMSGVENMVQIPLTLSLSKGRAEPAEAP
jgi:hypothetical protein